MQTFKAELLVIGGGVAGLFAAITAREAGCDVLLADKAAAGKAGATIMASGQWNAFNPDWGMDYDACYRSIQESGGWLCHPGWLEVMLRESWASYEDLKRWGVRFPYSEEQMEASTRLSQSGTEAAPRFDWAMLPLIQREVPGALRRHAQKIGVRLLDRTMITELTVEQGCVIGAVGFAVETAEPAVIRAGATVLCGGKNGFRAPGMNIAGQTGDADAMAYRAGAVLSGKEFPDMHMNIERDPVWKGNGELYPPYWVFVDGEGNRIPTRGFDLSMASVIHAGKGPVVWDFAHASQDDVERMREYIRKRGMPQEVERVNLGWDTGVNEKIIGGAAGGSPAESSAGVWPTDLCGASTLPGLWAAGDCCCTWAWGAIDRFAPPGLMHAAVGGKRAAAAAMEYAKKHPVDERVPDGALEEMLQPLERKTGYDPRWVTQQLQGIMMPYYVLHIKKADRLQAALTNVLFLKEHMGPRLKAGDAHELRLCHETRNMILNAEMILRASLAREESRGWHYREDFPEPDNENWLAWGRMWQGENGMETDKVPVPRAGLPEDPSPEHPWLAWEVQ